MSTTDWIYPLTTLQTPACGYASSGWSVVSNPYSSGPTILGDKPEFFDNSLIASTGQYTITVEDGNNDNRLGDYEIQIFSVTINGVTYDKPSLVAPSSFILTVYPSTALCQSAVVTASHLVGISISVWTSAVTYQLPPFYNSLS